ncbi:MAG: undecaprenyl/decaprenyl-phosphate alpha-N-acetylglucosaminyl 1-phosphate transferase [Armatimonadetes bacterium]|nr:undecaprenyl/decaprenyl-phosphate alpha-N-acetylglucosaminyl 1-phosphate transferase [Armatimonadota bacterium]
MHGWVFLLSFAVSLALMPAVRALSWRLDILDRPNDRKVHREPTPLLGGLAIYGGFLTAIAALAWSDRLLQLFLACCTFLLILGLVDDRLDLHARHRLVLQVLVAGVVAAAGVRFSLGMGMLVAIVVTVVWLIGVVNATNCLDCIDGAAGTYTLVACGWFFLLAIGQGRLVIAALAVALAGGALGFLRHNFPPATIFMGDLGSTFVGLMLGILSLATAPAGRPDLFRFPVETLVLVPLAYDFLLVHLRRYRGGIRNLRDLLSSAGKDHLPHRLLAMSLSPREADLVLGCLAMVWGLAAWLLAQGYAVGGAMATLLGTLALFYGEDLLLRLTRRRAIVAPVVLRHEALDGATGGD